MGTITYILTSFLLIGASLGFVAKWFSDGGGLSSPSWNNNNIKQKNECIVKQIAVIFVLHAISIILREYLNFQQFFHCSICIQIYYENATSRDSKKQVFSIVSGHAVKTSQHVKNCKICNIGGFCFIFDIYSTPTIYTTLFAVYTANSYMIFCSCQ